MPEHPGLDQTSAWQRAAVVAAFSLLPRDRAVSLVQRLADGARCAEVARRVARWPVEERAAWLERERDVLARPHPGPGTDQSWLEYSLRAWEHRMPLPELFARLERPGPDGAYARWCAHAAFGRLVPVHPDGERGAPGSGIHRLLHLPVRSLVGGLHEYGLYQTAWALGPLEDGAPLAIGYVMHHRDVDALRQHARHLTRYGERLGVGSREATAARTRDIDFASDPCAFSRVAARALAPHVAASRCDLDRRVAQRLPFVHGSAILEELQSEFRARPLDAVPGANVFFRLVDGLERSDLAGAPGLRG